MDGGGKDRLHVFPSRVALTNVKLRCTMSQKGASLLQKRADALAFHYRLHSNKALRSILETQLAMKRSRMSLAETAFISGNKNHQLFECITNHARIKYKARYENVAGVKLIIFDKVAGEDLLDRSKMIGLGRGAEQLNRCRTAFGDLLEHIVQQSSLRYGLKAIDKAFLTTNIRINGLKNVVIPRLKNTMKHITTELEEEEREEHFRRKKVQTMKRRKKLEAEEKRSLLQKVSPIFAEKPV